MLYEWLSDVTLHERYLPDLTLADVQTRGAALAAGACWRESRRSLLFLRDWATVQCTAADPAAGSFSLALDDGYNHVLTSYVVVPLGMSTARVTQVGAGGSRWKEVLFECPALVADTALLIALAEANAVFSSSSQMHVQSCSTCSSECTSWRILALSSATSDMMSHPHATAGCILLHTRERRAHPQPEAGRLHGSPGLPAAAAEGAPGGHGGRPAS